MEHKFMRRIMNSYYDMGVKLKNHPKIPTNLIRGIQSAERLLCDPRFLKLTELP